MRDISNEYPNAPFLWASADRTLSSGVRMYNNLPANFEKMYDMTIPSGNIKLTYLTPNEFDMLAPSATAGGNPAVYTIRNTGSSPTMEFYWVPSDAPTVHMNYQSTIDTVSAGSSSPVIPIRYFELPVLYGERNGLRRRGMRAEAMQVDAEYQRLKIKMIDDLNRLTTENQRIKNGREFMQNINPIDDPIRRIFNVG